MNRIDALDLILIWVEQDHVIEQDCPVDGNFIPMQDRLQIMEVWGTIKDIPGTYNLDIPNYAAERETAVRPKREVFTGGMIGAGQAIREERLGESIGRFECIYVSETEDHLSAVIEAFDQPCYMSFHDAVNAANVE